MALNFAVKVEARLDQGLQCWVNECEVTLAFCWSEAQDHNTGSGIPTAKACLFLVWDFFFGSLFLSSDEARLIKCSVLPSGFIVRSGTP